MQLENALQRLRELYILYNDTNDAKVLDDIKRLVAEDLVHVPKETMTRPEMWNYVGSENVKYEAFRTPFRSDRNKYINGGNYQSKPTTRTDRVLNILERAFEEDEPDIEELVQEIEGNNGTDEYESYPESGMPDDTHIWEEKLAKLKKDNRYIKILWGTDIHFPFHSPQALSIFYQIAEEYKPDIVPIGSDMWEFDNLSRWQPIQGRTHVEPIQEIFQLTKQHCEFFRDINPDVIEVFLDGNHDRRILTYLIENTPILADWSANNFANQLIRENGVLWRGFKKPRLRITPNLRIEHGDLKKFSGTESFAIANNKKFDTDVVTGDKHRSQVSHITLEGRHKSSYGVGCLCKLNYIYDELDDDPKQHQHGFALITVDTQTNKNYVENMFIDSFTYTTMWGGKIYTANSDYYV